MNSIQAVIDKLKRKHQDATGSSDGAPLKFVKRGEIKAEQESRPVMVTSPVDSRPSAKEQLNSVAANKSAKASFDQSSIEVDEISELMVKTLLRNICEPVTLFGETAKKRLERLKAVQMHKHEKEESSHGQKNVMNDIKMQVEKDANELDDLNDDIDDGEGGSRIGEGGEDASKQRRRQLLQNMEALNAVKYAYNRPRSDFETPNKYVLFSVKRWLYVWEKKLASREKEVTSSFAGQRELAMLRETRTYLKPFINETKNKTIEEDVLSLVVEIVDLAQQRQYLKAHESFLMLAIGDAAWPMGVTMVGIHERAGREKIFNTKVAHILNDEKKRKYIQALKRLLSFLQEEYPTDPSKMFVK